MKNAWVLEIWGEDRPEVVLGANGDIFIRSDGDKGVALGKKKARLQGAVPRLPFMLLTTRRT